MCENCGINHDTAELEDPNAFNAFLSRLISDDGGESSALNELITSMFTEPEPAEDYFAKYGLTSEYDLFGSNELVNDWKVSVARPPLDSINENHELFGYAWVLQGYHEGNLVRSTAGTPPEPVTAKEAAEAYAEWEFGYEIEE